MGVIPNGASGYTPQVQGYAINGSGGENLRLEDRTEGAVKTHLEGTKGAENASGFSLFGGAIGGIINGIFNGWFGGGGVGEPQQVQYTIEAIKDAIINGYNVETKITSGTWTKPENITELIVIGVGGGRSGANGSTTVAGPGGVGGEGGGFTAQTIDPAEVGATVPYTIGQSNQATTFGSFLSVNGGSGGIAGPFGYTPTTSAPGSGGRGGVGAPNTNENPTAGQPGTGSALAAGGSAGASGGPTSNGGPGGAGGNVSAATTTKCGGGGGGGGAGGGVALIGTTRSAGAGGPGGYPGGGGGGGGSRGYADVFATSVSGAGGIGATGIIWIFWR